MWQVSSLTIGTHFKRSQCLNAPEFLTVGKSDQLELIAVSERTRADRIELRANGKIDQSEIRAIFEGTFSNALELLASYIHLICTFSSQLKTRPSAILPVTKLLKSTFIRDLQ